MAVDPVYAQWLQDEARWALAENAIIKARWGETAIASQRVTSIAIEADAQEEADRQLAFMAGPLAEDEHNVPIGSGWVQYIGAVITLTGPELGYEAGKDVFLIDAQDDHSKGLSTLLVLCRL